jgi:predicted transcriptional regulator
MRRNRDATEITVDILRATLTNGCKTGILLTANLSFALMEKYLNILVKADLLYFDSKSYKLTEKGQLFLQEYDKLKPQIREAETVLKKLELQRKDLQRQFLIKEKQEFNTTQPKEFVSSEKEFFAPKCSLARIDCIKFYEELKTLGFSQKVAKEIISWIDLINISQPAFFSGKKINVIKTCLAYTASKILESPCTLTRNSVAKFFGTSPTTIQRVYKNYLLVLKKAKPDYF